MKIKLLKSIYTKKEEFCYIYNQNWTTYATTFDIVRYTQIKIGKTILKNCKKLLLYRNDVHIIPKKKRKREPKFVEGVNFNLKRVYP